MYQTDQLDECGGHAGRGDDYHDHVKPNCMIEQMDHTGADAMIGWGFDGLPICADHNPEGSAIPAGTPDVCNGKADATFGYRCHTSADAPYILQSLMGEVSSFDQLPWVRPLTKARFRPYQSKAAVHPRSGEGG
ncbi:MAG: YHYH protein [Pseudomonadota bacterium]